MCFYEFYLRGNVKKDKVIQVSRFFVHLWTVATVAYFLKKHSYMKMDI